MALKAARLGQLGQAMPALTASSGLMRSRAALRPAMAARPTLVAAFGHGGTGPTFGAGSPAPGDFRAHSAAVSLPPEFSHMEMP